MRTESKDGKQFFSVLLGPKDGKVFSLSAFGSHLGFREKKQSFYLENPEERKLKIRTKDSPTDN